MKMGIVAITTPLEKWEKLNPNKENITSPS